MCSLARNVNSIGQMYTHAQCSYFKTFFQRDNLKTISKLNLLSMTIDRLFSRDFKIEYLSNNLEFFFCYYKFKQRYTSVNKQIQIQKINLLLLLLNWRFWSRTEESGHSIVHIFISFFFILYNVLALFIDGWRCGVQVNLINGTINIASRLPLIKTTMWVERILCMFCSLFAITTRNNANYECVSYITLYICI